jgi:hypothetical protein
LQLTPNDWLEDFQATLTAILGGSVMAGPGLAWRSGNYVVQSYIVATEPAVVSIIAIEVARGLDRPADVRFFFKSRDDPFESAQAVATWLYGKSR